MEIQTLRDGSCYSELELKSNCRPKSEKDGRLDKFFPQLTFSLKFTLAINSVSYI